jgi:hypothetical protein
MLNSLKFNKTFKEAVRQSSSRPDQKMKPFRSLDLKGLNGKSSLRLTLYFGVCGLSFSWTYD